MKKRISIGIAVTCLLVAAIVFYKTTLSGPSTGANKNREVYLVCANPKCAKTTTMKMDKYREHMIANGSDPMESMMGMGDTDGPTDYCPQCGELSCYKGMKCEECGEIFPINYALGKDAYKCPKCGYDKYRNLD